MDKFVKNMQKRPKSKKTKKKGKKKKRIEEKVGLGQPKELDMTEPLHNEDDFEEQPG